MAELVWTMGPLVVSLLWILPFVILLLFRSAGSGDTDRQRLAEAQRQMDVLAARGLTPREEGVWAGRVGGFEVRYQAREALEDPGGIDHCWGVAVPTGGLALRRGTPRDEARIGDYWFDRRFVVSGSAAERAFLTPAVRDALRDRERAWLKDGVLWFAMASFHPKDLSDLLEVALLFQQVSADEDARVRRSVDDPEPAVRRRALKAAFDHDPALASELALSFLEDEDLQVQTIAWILCDGTAREETIASREIDPELRLWSASVLGRLGTVEQRHRVGASLLQSPEPRLRSCGLSLLQSVGALAEPELLVFVQRAEGEQLGQVLLLLAQVGTPAAVPVLRQRQAGLSVLHSGLSSAIDHTIACIQQGLRETRGGLALADSPDALGALSVASQQGALGVVRKGERQREGAG